MVVPKTPRVEKTGKSAASQIDKDAGNATPVIVTILVALILLFVAVTLEERDKSLQRENHDREIRQAQEAYDRELHTSQENAAYKYADQKNRVNQLKTVCDNNFKVFESLKVWVNQNGLKPPPEILISAPCVVVIEKEK